MGILALLLFGLIAGAVARLLMPGPDPGGAGLMGLIVTIGIGIIGAFVGGFLGSLMGFGGITGFDIRSFALAILGAVVFLAVWRALSGGGRGRRHAL